MNVEFRPPAIGSTQVPIKITGPGTLELRAEGLHVVGAKVATRGRSLVVLLALVLFGTAMVLLQRFLGLGSVSSGALAGVLGVGVLLPLLRQPAKAGERVEHLFPWANVKKVTYDGAAQCVVVVIKGMKPRGGLFIVQPVHSELQRALEQRLG